MLKYIVYKGNGNYSATKVSALIAEAIMLDMTKQMILVRSCKLRTT